MKKALTQFSSHLGLHPQNKCIVSPSLIDWSSRQAGSPGPLKVHLLMFIFLLVCFKKATLFFFLSHSYLQSRRYCTQSPLFLGPSPWNRLKLIRAQQTPSVFLRARVLVLCPVRAMHVYVFRRRLLAPAKKMLSSDACSPLRVRAHISIARYTSEKIPPTQIWIDALASGTLKCAKYAVTLGDRYDLNIDGLRRWESKSWSAERH